MAEARLHQLRSASQVGGNWNGYEGFDPATAPNNGAGFFKDLSGNELPNAPNYTATFMADYTVPLRGNWTVTLHTDLYWQSSAWWSIFNDHEYARLKPYMTTNVAAILVNDYAGWNIMAYVKNVLDRDSISGAFLNSDDTGLTTNVFLTEPRLYGLRFTSTSEEDAIMKKIIMNKTLIAAAVSLAFTPMAMADTGAEASGYPFSIAFSGGAMKVAAPVEMYAPAWLSEYGSDFPGPVTFSNDPDWGMYEV